MEIMKKWSVKKDDSRGSATLEIAGYSVDDAIIHSLTKLYHFEHPVTIKQLSVEYKSSILGGTGGIVSEIIGETMQGEREIYAAWIYGAEEDCPVKSVYKCEKKEDGAYVVEKIS